jgi:D-xylose transport system substrate-binding protein
VVVPKDADADAPIVTAAHKKGVKVLAYDRLITKADTDLYISFDNFEVGRIQARAVLAAVPEGKYLLLGGDPGDKNAGMLRSGQMEILQPAVDAGAIQIVANPFCDKWLRSEATRHTEDALAKNPDIAAIVASNDGTAAGAIAALKKAERAGAVAVSGQDADVEGCQNVVQGQQTVTVYKPIRAIAEASAEIAVALAEGKDVATAMALVDGAAVQEIDNGKVKVPTIFLTPVPVTKDNIDDTVIADGFHSRQVIYGEE